MQFDFLEDGCGAGEDTIQKMKGDDMLAYPWREVEITLTAARDYANAYTDVEVWADFRHENGDTLRRPAFWDGGRTWMGHEGGRAADCYPPYR